MENGRAVKRQFCEIRTPAPSCKPGVDRILQAGVATTLVAGWKVRGLMIIVCLSRVRTKGKALRKCNDWTQLPQGHWDSQHLGCVVGEREIKKYRDCWGQEYRRLRVDWQSGLLTETHVYQRTGQKEYLDVLQEDTELLGGWGSGGRCAHSSPAEYHALTLLLIVM